MTYREYIQLTENLGLERKHACCYYMHHGVCIFWFDISGNDTGIVKLINDTEIVKESTDKEQIRAYIAKRIEDIKAIKVDKKLKKMEQDFE